MGTVHLLEGLTQYGWQGAFLFASSGAVYGGITGRVDEDSPTTVSSPYVASKLAAESAVRRWAGLAAYATRRERSSARASERADACARVCV